jgi:excisionase family DNA binding protein
MTIVGAVAGTIPANGGNMTMEVEKRAFSINEFCGRYGVGRTTAYDEIKAKRLLVVKVGKRTLVPRDAAESWLKNLPTTQAVS